MVTGQVPQTTLKNAIECTGIGIHSGQPVRLVLKPAPANAGICFRRLDVKGRAALVPARFDLVSDTRLGTTLSNADGVSVHTVEHLMAALAGLSIDNATVEVEGPELPIMDGSAAPFVFLIECAGVKRQSAPRRVIRVLKRVIVSDGDKLAELAPHPCARVSVEIDFDNPVIARQGHCIDLTPHAFKMEIARARTFGFRHEVEYLQQNGLARGGSLDNSIVLDGAQILNAGGLRFSDEFARHKLLDAIGDLYLAGAPLLGQFRGVRTGHTLNNRLLRVVFSDPDAFRVETETAPRAAEERMAMPLVAATA